MASAVDTSHASAPPPESRSDTSPPVPALWLAGQERKHYTRKRERETEVERGGGTGEREGRGGVCVCVCGGGDHKLRFCSSNRVGLQTANAHTRMLIHTFSAHTHKHNHIHIDAAASVAGTGTRNRAYQLSHNMLFTQSSCLMLHLHHHVNTSQAHAERLDRFWFGQTVSDYALASLNTNTSSVQISPAYMDT